MTYSDATFLFDHDNDIGTYAHKTPITILCDIKRVHIQRRYISTIASDARPSTMVAKFMTEKDYLTKTDFDGCWNRSTR